MKPTISKSRSVADEVPSLASVHRPYAELIEKRSKLWGRRSALEDERRELYRRETPEIAPLAADVDQQSRVAVLLGEKPLAKSPERKPGDVQRLSEIRIELSDIEVALGLLERRIRAEGLAASALVCDQVKPLFEEIQRQAIEAVLDLYEANRTLIAFADHMNLSEVSWSELNPVLTDRLAGQPGQADGPIGRVLRDAIDAGWLKLSDLPQELR